MSRVAVKLDHSLLKFDPFLIFCVQFLLTSASGCVMDIKPLGLTSSAPVCALGHLPHRGRYWRCREATEGFLRPSQPTEQAPVCLPQRGRQGPLFNGRTVRGQFNTGLRGPQNPSGAARQLCPHRAVHRKARPFQGGQAP